MYRPPYGQGPPGLGPQGRPRLRRRRRRSRRRFNKAFLLVPAAVLILLWLIGGIEPAGTWDDVMDALNVQNRERYTMLMCLCLVCVAVVTTCHIFRKSKDEE